MINPFREVNWRPDRSGLQSFARSLLIGFPVLAVVFAIVGRVTSGAWSAQVPLAIAAGGVGAGLVCLVLPAIARPFYIVWYGLACSIGFVVSNVLMAVVYYGLFTPIGLVMRLLGRRPLTVGPDRTRETYWQEVAPSGDRSQYFRQF